MIFNLLLFEINRIYRPKTYREAYNTIYRAKGLQLLFGTFKELQVVVVILIALSAQISTSAILLNQVFGLNIIVGSVLFCIAVMVIALWGAVLLRKVGTALSICILVICIFIAVVCMANAWPGAMEFLGSRTSYTEFGFGTASAWFQMLMIVVFFMNGYEACVPASIGIIQSVEGKHDFHKAICDCIDLHIDLHIWKHFRSAEYYPLRVYGIYISCRTGYADSTYYFSTISLT